MRNSPRLRFGVLSGFLVLGLLIAPATVQAITVEQARQQTEAARRAEAAAEQTLRDARLASDRLRSDRTRLDRQRDQLPSEIERLRQHQRKSENDATVAERAIPEATTAVANASSALESTTMDVTRTTSCRCAKFVNLILITDREG